jgi:hypothetical protein
MGAARLLDSQCLTTQPQGTPIITMSIITRATAAELMMCLMLHLKLVRKRLL